MSEVGINRWGGEGRPAPQPLTEITLTIENSEELIDFYLAINKICFDYGSKGYIEEKKLKSFGKIAEQIAKALWPDNQ